MVQVVPKTPREVRQLFRAAKHGDIHEVKRLLQQGVPVDGEVAPGWTSLFVASGQGNHAVVEALIDAGASVNRTLHPDFSALFAAVIEGRLKVVQLLLARGANPNITPGGVPLVALIPRGDPNDARIRELLTGPESR